MLHFCSVPETDGEERSELFTSHTFFLPILICTFFSGSLLSGFLYCRILYRAVFNQVSVKNNQAITLVLDLV